MRCPPRLALFTFAAFMLVSCSKGYADPAQPPAAAKTDSSKPPPNCDPKADALLRKMTTTLSSTKAFQVDADHVLEVVTKDGEKLQFVAQSRVSIERPDKLRSERIGPIADLSFYYDGKTMTIYGKKTGMYASTPAPNTIDGAFDFARDKLGIDVPAADLIYADSYTGLMDDVTSGTYVGLEPVSGRMCHHLAYRGHETDWQVWIEDTPQGLPCRYVVTSKNIKGIPEYAVSFSNWNLSPKLAASDFQFTPPSDATKIDFLALRQAAPTKGNKP